MRIGLTNLGLTGSGKTGTAAAAFSPSSLFAGGQTGAWYDQSDITTGFQDVNGTVPQTATGQTTGMRLDKSGRGHHVSQGTTANMPIYTVAGAIKSDVCNGTTQGLLTTFAAATLTTTMDIYVAIKRSNTQNGIVTASAAGGNFVGCWDNTDQFNPTTNNAGAAFAIAVNGSAIADTRQALGLALPTGTWCVLEYTNVDLSTWAGLGLSNYNGTFFVAGEYGGMIVCPTLSAGVRAQTRTWLGAKVGLVI